MHTVEAKELSVLTEHTEEGGKVRSESGSEPTGLVGSTKIATTQMPTRTKVYVAPIQYSRETNLLEKELQQK
jgi:hypothetical protein